MLPLLCLLPPDHIGGDVGLNEVGGPQVAHSAQQVEGPVSHGHQRVPASVVMNYLNYLNSPDQILVFGRYSYSFIFLVNIQFSTYFAKLNIFSIWSIFTIRDNFLLNRMVLPRWVGLVNLANMIPVTQAVMNTPMTLWTLITRMAPGHWVEVIRPPYLEKVEME